MPGKELSVESFSFSGHHHIISITEKEIIDGEENCKFVEIAHKMPAAISEKQTKAIKLFIEKFLKQLNYNDGPAHTEIKLHDSNIYVIETHNRIGGDRIYDLVKLSTGIYLIDLSLLCLLNRCELNILDNKPSKGAAIRFFKPRTGVVKKSMLYAWHY